MVEEFKRTIVRNDGPQTGTDTVTIGCKWPSGLVMRLYRVIEDEIVINGVPRKEIRSVLDPNDPEYVLNGSSIDLGKMAGGIPPDHEIIGGYGLTHGIPRDFAEKWFEQNKLSEFVKNNIVFMASSEQRARDQAKDQKSIQSGVEPIDPNNPSPRAGLRPGTVQKEQPGAA
jgi:hypothetical protein